MNDEISIEERDFMIQTLRECLDESMYLNANVAIYRSEDGYLSYHAYSGTAPIAYGDEIIHTWGAGSYQDDDPYEDVEDMLVGIQDSFN